MTGEVITNVTHPSIDHNWNKPDSPALREAEVILVDVVVEIEDVGPPPLPADVGLAHYDQVPHGATADVSNPSTDCCKNQCVGWS